ncbi:hypothetical protein ACFCV8_18305 [Streptomyces sp. NPDC056347]|uniref:hypothetical protein n=1 Tax=Streptomyces sp. NPDC056347 TaxID=3345790 RepID=UPI0035DAA26F
MRPGVRNGLVVAWVVLAAGGWGAAQWLGEPAATGGPAPVAPPSPGAGQEPQPDSDADADADAVCGRLMAASPGPRAQVLLEPSPPADPVRQKPSGVVICTSARLKTGD